MPGLTQEAAEAKVRQQMKAEGKEVAPPEAKPAKRKPAARKKKIDLPDNRVTASGPGVPCDTKPQPGWPRGMVRR